LKERESFVLRQRGDQSWEKRQNTVSVRRGRAPLLWKKVAFSSEKKITGVSWRDLSNREKKGLGKETCNTDEGEREVNWSSTEGKSIDPL